MPYTLYFKDILENAVNTDHSCRVCGLDGTPLPVVVALVTLYEPSLQVALSSVGEVCHADEAASK